VIDRPGFFTVPAGNPEVADFGAVLPFASLTTTPASELEAGFAHVTSIDDGVARDAFTEVTGPVCRPVFRADALAAAGHQTIRPAANARTPASVRCRTDPPTHSDPIRLVSNLRDKMGERKRKTWTLYKSPGCDNYASLNDHARPLSSLGERRKTLTRSQRVAHKVRSGGANRAGRLTAVVVTLGEITDGNREAVVALRVAPGQERFVSSVRESLAVAAQHWHARPWYRAVFAGGEPVGFVMVSWNVEPRPPEIIGPWFLWKLLIGEQHQGQGYGTEVVRQVTELVRAEGATELLTSYVPGEGGPAGFYERLGFAPTGDLDVNGEVIMRLMLTIATR
jgi:diamine N-acetyltransferase